MNLKQLPIALALLVLTALLALGCSSQEGSGATSSATSAATSSTPTVSAPSFPGGGRPPGGAFSDNMTPPAMDWAAAATKLGVTEQELKDAMGGTQGRPDMAAAAEKLGVSEDALQEALGFPAGMSRAPGGTPPTPPTNKQ